MEETVKQLLTQIKKYSKLEDLSHIYLDSLKRVLFLLDGPLCSFIRARIVNSLMLYGLVKGACFLA